MNLRILRGLREAPPRRSKFPSVMSQLDEIEQNQNKEEDLVAKSQAAQVLREVEEEHERKEIDQKPEEEEKGGFDNDFALLVYEMCAAWSS